MAEMGTCTHYNKCTGGCRQKICIGHNRIKDEETGKIICRKNGIVSIKEHHYKNPFLSFEMGIIQ